MANILLLNYAGHTQIVNLNAVWEDNLISISDYLFASGHLVLNHVYHAPLKSNLQGNVYMNVRFPEMFLLFANSFFSNQNKKYTACKSLMHKWNDY